VALQDAWKRFIGTPYFRIVYIVVMALLTALLFPFAFGAAACLALLVIPLTIFVVPYWFGERRPRRLVVNGLVVFAIALPIVGAFQTGAVLDLPPFELSSFAFPGENTTMSLTNGTAAPYRVEGPANVTFRVLLTTTDNATPADFAVWLNLTRVDGFAFNAETFPMAPEPPVGNNTRNGTWFTVNATVPSAVVGTGFSVERQSDENWTRTGVYLGPITGSWGTYFGYFVLFSAPLLGLTLAFYLMILFMWWYTVRMRSRTVRRVPETEPEPAEEAAPAPASGTAGKAAAFTCTNCGADVGDDAVKCPKCGATFED
jgi:hypothetical protein